MAKNIKGCDLHTHTIHSDGTYTPTELVDAAKEAGLSAIALTDHNSVSGLDEFSAAARAVGIEAACGVEFSTEYNGTELHVIGMFICHEDHERVMDFIGDIKKKKDQANRELVSKLRPLGYEIDYDALISATPDGYVNRAHIAAEMVKKGYVKSFSEAFDGVLSEKAGYYVPPKRRGFFKTVEFIESIGAVSILAHPLLQLSREELRELAAAAIGHGLCAIETQYVKYTAEEREFSTALASELLLLESGGSDFHGDNKPEQMLGVGSGDLFVPYEFYEKLRKRSRKTRK